MYQHLFQEPNDAYDNPFFLEMYEREVVTPEVRKATECGDIENEDDLDAYVDRLWTKYFGWLNDYFRYEEFHE